MKTNYLNIKKFADTGTDFLSSQDRFVLNKSIKKIEKLSEEALGNGSVSTFEAETILEEYWRLVNGPVELFKAAYSRKRKRKKLLIVFNTPYNGKKISTDVSVPKLISLFDTDQSEVTLNRWISSLISSWEDIMKSNRNFDTITNFILYKFNTIPLKLKRTKLLFVNRNLFLKTKGTHYFVREIIERKITHAKLCEQVGIRFDKSSYHAMVVEELFDFYLVTKKYNEAIEIVKDIAKTPSRFYIRSRKKIVSSFILHVDKKGLTEYKELAKSTGYDSSVIGDPEKRSNWTVWEGGDHGDKMRMEEARFILNKWILTSFVNVFFNLLINDPKRKAYWLEKIPLISSVKVYGSPDVKRILKRDERISPYVDNYRFKTIHSGRSNAGILMELGAYQVIEFTDSGALYCYKKANERIPEHIKALSDLKVKNFQMACATQELTAEKRAYMHGKSYFLNSEGRIVHKGTSGFLINGKIIEKDSWMERVDLWIKYFVL